MLPRQEESLPSASRPGAPEKTVSLSSRVITSNFGIACHWLRELTLARYLIGDVISQHPDDVDARAVPVSSSSMRCR